MDFSTKRNPPLTIARSSASILCAEKDNLEVEPWNKTASREAVPQGGAPGGGRETICPVTKGNPLGVAEYQLQPKLPAELKGKLPTAKQLADAMKVGKQ